MKKHLLLLITLSLFLVTNCLAQDKGYIAISLGPSIPIGDFSSKNANNESAGWAQTGAIIDFSFAYKFGKNFGISVLLRGQANGIDNNALASELTKQAGGSWTVNSKAWSIGGFMFGGYGSFPISDKVSFDSRAMIGFLSSTSPELNITLNGSGGAGWIKQSSVTATSFSYLIGGGFKFDVGRKICLLANLDYLGSKPEFRDVEITSSNGGAPEKNTYSQSFGTINFGIGIGYRL